MSAGRSGRRKRSTPESSGRKVGKGSQFQPSIPCDEKTTDGSTEVAFPADACGTDVCGGENGKDGTSIKKDHEDREKDGERGLLVEARGDQKAEVAKDDRTGSDVV